MQSGYQQIITFMVTATTGLGVLSVVYFCIHHLLDKQHRLRPERVHKYQANVVRDIKFLLESVWDAVFHRDKKQGEPEPANENTPLLA